MSQPPTLPRPSRRQLVLLDVAAPLLAYPLGLLPSLLVLAAIILLEALVLLALRWGPFRLAVRDALIANGLSALMGAILILVVQAVRPLEADAVLNILVGGFFLSLLIEGTVLMALRRHSRRRAWLAALATNAVSYGLLLGPLTIWLLSQGKFDGY